MESKGSVPHLSLRQRIRIARENSGLKQAEMAAKIGIGRATYAKTEQGLRDPRRGELLAIATLTGTDFAWLATGETPTGGTGGSEGGTIKDSNPELTD